MVKIPEKLGSEYYRGFLTRQGQAFYDRINAQLLRGDYSGKTTFSISNPETSASDCFAAYKAIRDDRPEFFFLGFQSEFTRRGRTGTLEYPILYAPEIIDRIRQQLRKKIFQIVRGTADLSMLEREALVYERIAKSIVLMKQDIQEYGVQETYKSPSVVESVDWKRIYSVLDGSGCGLCIQIIPALLSDDERRLIAKNAAHCSQAVDGIVPNMRDSLAVASADRWKYYAQKVANPFAKVNLVVAGTVTSAALVTARIKQSVHGTAFRTIAVSAYQKYSIYNQPWKVSHELKKSDAASLRKWTSDEISQIFQLPTQGNYFIGTDRNAFSLMPEVDLLPEQLTNNDREGLYLGQSVYSSKRLFVPLEQLLLHTAVMGKSGVGKTTLLKKLITQFQSRGIPVLLLEPVKREYRDLVAGMKDSRVFTVERPVVPLLINPFYVPKDVPLGEYRSSLLSAFKAAFSLPDPLPALFEKAISEAYTLNGWTDISTSEDGNVSIFDMADFVRVFKRVISRSSYSNEVKGNMMSGGAFRLQSLIERCPRTFDTIHSTSVEDLLNGCVVLEMGSLEPEQKSLVSALTLISILAYELSDEEGR